jgi:hypothetical protein
MTTCASVWSIQTTAWNVLMVFSFFSNQWDFSNVVWQLMQRKAAG